MRRKYISDDGHIQCSGCNKWKLLDEFYRHPKHTTGRCSRCKVCIAAHQKEYSQTDGWKVVQKRSYLGAGRFVHTRSSAKRHGHEWHLTREEFWGLVMQPCHYCGEEPNEEVRIGIDRADNKREYVIDNVVSCCINCNITKGDRFTEREMKAMMNVVQQMREEE